MAENDIFGYASRLHVRNGESVDFHVSAEGDEPFQASLVRLANACVDRAHNRYREVALPAAFAGAYQGRRKKIYPGSYARLEVGRMFAGSDEHTVQFCVYPTALSNGRRQTILSLRGGQAAAVEIEIHDRTLAARFQPGPGSAQGTPQGSTQSAELRIAEPLQERAWHLVAVSWDSSAPVARIRMWRFANAFHQPRRLVFFESAAALSAPKLGEDAKLVLGASLSGADENGQVVVRDCFDGKMDALRIARKSLEPDAVLEAATYAPSPAVLGHLTGVFNFSPGAGLSFRNEMAPHQAGAFHNLPLLGVTGVRWDGSAQSFSTAPSHYSAVHFHADDLYDCGWSRDFRFTVPDTLKSGIYAAKVVNQSGKAEYMPFFVTPAKSTKKRPAIAVMLPTMSYLAYANERMSDASEKLGFDVVQWGGQVEPDLIGYERLRANPAFGASLYDHHADGGGRHFSSWLRPIMNMRPKSAIWSMAADTLICDWLERMSFDYDIITDHVVHEDGAAALAAYSVVISGNHPEYVSTEILDAIGAYTNERGGRFVYMGGNGYYWVTGIEKDAPCAIEVRRGVGGSGAWFSQPGEYHLQSTGQLGGLWRHVGRAPQQLFGVGTRGMGFPGSIGFTRTADWNNPRVAFLTAGITEDVLGDYGMMGNGAAGEEIDAVDFALGTPRHALVIARSQNHPRGMMIAREDLRFVVPDEWVHAQVHADLTFFETASGGAVLSLSSMTWCGSLSHNGGDNGVSRLTANALRRFSDPTPFEMPKDF
jgi:N,N-dimethylformamidase